MGLTLPMFVALVIAGGYVLASGLLLPRGLTVARSPGQSARQRLGARGLHLLLLPDVLAAAWVAAHAGLTGSVGKVAPLALAAVALALWAFAPRYVTSKVFPLALVVIGLDGFVQDKLNPYLPYTWPGAYGFGSPDNPGAPYHSGPTATLVQAWAFIAVGLWLAWRRMDPDSRPYQLICYEPAAGGSGRSWWSSSRASTAVRSRAASEPKGRGRPRWGLVLLLVAVLIFERLTSVFGWLPLANQLLWLVPMAAIVGAATFLAFRFPAVASDLAIAGLIAFGLDGIFHDRVREFGLSLRDYGMAMIGPNSSDRVTMLAGAQALALIAAGIWLLPRALDDRTKALFRPAADRELAGRVARLTQTRADAVDSAAAELRRVERDLHDGAQARLVALGIILRGAERLIHSSPDAAAELVAQARESSLTALGELRDLVRGIRPPVLADRGLADAVQALALDTPLRTVVDVDLPGRPDLAVESACYFAVAELLANAVKHAGARQAHVQISYDAGVVLITVTDDGAGGADPSRGTGLAGLERRLATFDGVLAISSPPGGPTIAAIEVPCALSSLKTSTC